MESENLTIKWINGELPDGWYYVELKDGVTCKDRMSMSDGFAIAYIQYLQYPYKKISKITLLWGRVGYKSIRRIVAKVPTYTECGK